MYNYYKIQEIIDSEERGHLFLLLHDLQSRKFDIYEISINDGIVYLHLDEESSKKVIGISKKYPCAYIYACGQPLVKLNDNDLACMSDRMESITKLEDVFHVQSSLNGALIKRVYLDSWLIVEK